MSLPALSPDVERPLHAVSPALRIDEPRARAAVTELLRALGRDVAGEQLSDTPRRVVDGLIEMLVPQDFAMTTFPNDEEYSDLVLVRGIPFTSLCAHHLLPFQGTADVGYLPGDRLIGLSKLARIVDLYARDLQVQERLTVQIADHLERQLQPDGVGVVLRAEHLCMSMRGARAVGATTETSVFRGDLAEDDRLLRRFEASRA
jgi:GTP cyclohydrolase IA